MRALGECGWVTEGVAVGDGGSKEFDEAAAGVGTLRFQEGRIEDARIGRALAAVRVCAATRPGRHRSPS